MNTSQSRKALRRSPPKLNKIDHGSRPAFQTTKNKGPKKISSIPRRPMTNTNSNKQSITTGVGKGDENVTDSGSGCSESIVENNMSYPEAVTTFSAQSTQNNKSGISLAKKLPDRNVRSISSNQI
jgi:hypothetical protein